MRLSVIARTRVKRTVPQLLRLACFVALVGLAVFASSIFYPKPLVVIFSMSIGHAIGMLAGALYVLAIVLDTVRPASVEPIPLPNEGDREAVQHEEPPGGGADGADAPPASKN